MNEDARVLEFERDVADEMLQEDFLSHINAPIVNAGGVTPISIPEAVFLKLDSEKAKNALDVTLTMIKDFHGDIGEGTGTDAEGTEEDYELKTFKMQCNDIFHVHADESYGNEARLKAAYNMIEKGPKLEARYFQAAVGRYRRQGVVEMQSANLLAYPVYNAAMLNPNVFVCGVSDAKQPAYSMVAQNHLDNVVHALNHAGTGTDSAASIHFFHRLEEWCFEHLDPLEDAIGQYFIVSLPSKQITWLKDNGSNRTFGSMYQIPDNQKDLPRFRFPGFVDKVGRLIFVEDQLYPTITISGSPSASAGTHDGTLTVQYRGMGRADDGSSDPRDKTATARQVGMIFGRGGLCEWWAELLHVEYNYENYDRRYGSGMFGVYGCKGVAYDVQDPTHSYTYQHSGTAICIFGPPPISTY
jgi:hypothetical protein